MPKSNKSEKQSKKAQVSNLPEQAGRRQFLRRAGVAGAAVAAVGLTPLAKAQSESDRVNLNVALDADKVRAIQKCLAKGTLRISMSKAGATGVVKGDPWLYD